MKCWSDATANLSDTCCLEHLLCFKLCSKCFLGVHPINPHTFEKYIFFPFSGEHTEAQRRYATQPNNLALNSRQLWLAHTAPFWNWCKTPWRLGASPPCHLGPKPLQRVQTTQPSMVALLAEVGSEPQTGSEVCVQNSMQVGFC